MNKQELDQFLKKNPTRKSKYAQYKDEIEYLYNNGATLDAISEFLFKKYKMSKTNTTLHYYIHRNILKSKNKNKPFNSVDKIDINEKKILKVRNEKGMVSFESNNTATKVGK